MQNRLFRKKSLEQISSPEQLHDYMRVTNPAIWMVLGAVIALLAGLIILASVNRLETTLDLTAKVEDGIVYAKVPSENAKDVDEGIPMRVAGQELTVDYVYQDEDGETVCLADLVYQNRKSIPDGLYEAEIVTDSISPISFLLN